VIAEVRGGGLAACAAALALHARGVPVRLVAPPGTASGPTLVLNDVSLALLRELAPELSIAGHSLEARQVRWADEPVRRIVSRAVAVPTEHLLEGLLDSVARRLPVATEPAGARWTLYAGPEPPAVGRQHLGGRRQLLAVTGEWRGDRDYVVESVQDGWLIAFPTATGAVLQAVLPSAGRDPARQLGHLLRDSQLARRVVVDGPPRVFEAAPFARTPLTGDGWISVGRSAARLDPISGEGTPFAIRSVLLAAAVVADVESGRVGRAEALLHYRNRIALTVLAHFKSCAAFYMSAFSAHLGWRDEIRRLSDAHRSLREATTPPAPGGLTLRLGRSGLEPVRVG